MSKYLSSVAVTEFDKEVKHAYQTGGFLRKTVKLRSNVTGDTYKFRKMGSGMASEKIGHASAVTAMEIDHSLITATLKNYEASEYTDIFDQSEVDFAEKVELAKAIAMAMGRRDDQLIIDALEGATYSATPTSAQGLAIAAGSSGLTVDKLISARTGLMNRSVMGGRLTLITPASGLEDLLAEAEIGSNDYNTIKALVRGDINTFMGFDIMVIPTRSEGGITGSYAYVYDQNAVGLAVGFERMVDVNWIPERGSWLCSGWLKAGAAIIDPAGLVQIAYA